MMKEWDGTEGEALDDSGFTCELDPSCEQYQEEREEAMEQTRHRMQIAYNAAKSAKTGSEIACPTCGKKIVKTTYHKVFCSNGKTAKRGKNNCKDRFWNTTDIDRSERAKIYAKI